MRYLNIIYTILIFVTAVLGDHIVFNSIYSSSLIFRAFADTSVHGIIGIFSSLLFLSYVANLTTQSWLFNLIICAVISSIIDIDHFIVAKSFNLKDLTITNRRGIFHNTSFWIMLTTSLFIYSYITRKNNIYLLTYMIILGFTSHHIRDGNRRGIWLYPYGHTPPLSTHTYLTLISVLPTILAYIFNCTKHIFKQNVVQYTTV